MRCAANLMSCFEGGLIFVPLSSKTMGVLRKKEVGVRRVTLTWCETVCRETYRLEISMSRLQSIGQEAQWQRF